MVRQLNINDLSGSFNVVQNAIKGMQGQGLDQWDEIYPDQTVIENDIAKDHAYGFFEDQHQCAYIVLNEESPAEYETVHWKKVTGKFLIVHRLCVAPQSQGKGIARKLMHYSENYAKEQGYTSIRLDTFSKNPAAIRLYEDLGYSKMGTVNFRKGTFYVYEKLMV